MKLNKINHKIFKTTIFAITTSCLLVGGLKAINIPNKNTTNSKIQPEIIYEYDDDCMQQIKINFENYDDEIIRDELLIFEDSNNTAYRTLPITNDGIIDTYVTRKNTKLISYELNKSINIPEVEENEIVVIDIDYNTQELDSHIELKSYIK